MTSVSMRSIGRRAAAPLREELFCSVALFEGRALWATFLGHSVALRTGRNATEAWKACVTPDQQVLRTAEAFQHEGITQ